MNASIITIGDELLNGQTIDTNSAWIAQKMNEIGLSVSKRVSVGDVFQDIWNALEQEEKVSKIILITGGLGPTGDDITKPLLCKYFNGNMVCHKETLELITSFFQKQNRPLLERNIQQSFVPDTCRVLINHLGTAPGMWFEKNDVIFISLPGVPFEMKGLMEKYVLDELKIRFQKHQIKHRFIIIQGLGESFIADKIQHIESKLPPFIKLAYLPSSGFVKLRLTGTHSNKEILFQELGKFQQQIMEVLKKNVVCENYENMLDYIYELCLNKNIKIACAESCTGGYLSHLLTQKSGASNFFLGSIVSYQNEIKKNQLNVDKASIEKYSAVSEEVVSEMLDGLLNQINADYGIAISGYMSGNREEIPVGLVYIAVGSKKHKKIHTLNLKYNIRQTNIETTAYQSLFFLSQIINHT